MEITEIEKIKQLKSTDDELVLDILDQTILDMGLHIRKSQIPKTLESLYWLMIHANFLKNGVFNCVIDDDPYSGSVLYRSMIEHFLRHTYLFLRFIEEKNDKPGTEFSDLADIKEYFGFYRADKIEGKIFRDEDMIKDVNDFVRSHFPSYNNFSNKALNILLDQFSIKKIVAFIWARMGKHFDEPGIIGRLLTDYAILSSHVHGGPHSTRLMLWWGLEQDEREKEKYKLAKQSYFYATYMKMNTYIVAGQYERKYLKLTRVIKEYATKFPNND